MLLFKWKGKKGQVAPYYWVNGATKARRRN